ncbi:Putative F-box protein At3g58860 [Linum perenne]
MAFLRAYAPRISRPPPPLLLHPEQDAPRLTTTFTSGGVGVDFISKLPDEIITKFLSLLTMREAVRTSVLSTRWISLWKSAVRVLDFDGWNLLQLPVINSSSSEVNGLDKEETFFDPDHIIIRAVPWGVPPRRKTGIVAERRLMYINWVNGVLRQLNGCSKINKFRIWFNFEIRCNSEGDIDRWLEFSISKRVEYLEISLGEADMVFDSCDWHEYVFSEACFQHIKTPAGLSNIKCLRSLRLSFVNVREEIFEYILSHCPLLEELAVERSSSVYNLKVTGSPSSPLALKYLEVSRCFCLTSLEIDHAPSLTRLSYGDGWVDLHVKNCSSLAHLSLAFADDYLPGFAFEYLSDYAGQLESLSLEIHPHDMEFPDFPQLTSLDLLTINVVGARKEYSILGLISLINVCPHLRTIRVELSLNYDMHESRDQPPVAVDKMIQESVKVVEISGFRGFEMECEFVEYVLECMVHLEKIVVHVGSLPGDSFVNYYDNEPQKSKERALELKSKAPPAVDFIVV